jgi:hypothetical protein
MNLELNLRNNKNNFVQQNQMNTHYQNKFIRFLLPVAVHTCDVIFQIVFSIETDITNQEHKKAKSQLLG